MNESRHTPLALPTDFDSNRWIITCEPTSLTSPKVGQLVQFITNDDLNEDTDTT
jgi:hypothetical protein